MARAASVEVMLDENGVQLIRIGPAASPQKRFLVRKAGIREPLAETGDESYAREVWREHARGRGTPMHGVR